MTLTVVSTGSVGGNCYAITAGGETLLLDAGVTIRKMIAAGVNFRAVVGALITHEHNDHTASMAALAARGVPVYASAGTIAAMHMSAEESPFVKVAVEGTVYDVGSFRIMPFRTEHDAAEPFGFLIRSVETEETVVYATDTYFLRNRFPGVNHWICECNYCDDLLPEDDTYRLKRSHMSLKHLLETFAANDMSTAQTIILVHLSDTHSDEERMIREISYQTKVFTLAANAGDRIELHKYPF